MKMFDTSQSLYQMEEILEQQLRKPENNIRILGDLPLSYEDYRYLLFKSRGLERYRGDLEVLDKFKLAILISWIFAMRLEKSDKNGYFKVQNSFLSIPQHHLRIYLNKIFCVFHEYKLNTFEVTDVENVEDLMALLVIHTGIPDDLQADFCHLLDDSLAYGDYNYTSIEYRFMMHMPEHMKSLYHFLEKKVIRNMINYSRDMFRDYRTNRITCREAYTKYPLMSSNLMRGCFDWCERQESYEMQRLG